MIEKANTIVEFKEMLRNKLSQSDDSCDVSSLLDFDRLLEEYNECIPEHLRCVSRNISCNGYHRCEHFRHSNLQVKFISQNSLRSGGERMMVDAVIWKTGNGAPRICHIITCLSHTSMTVGVG